MLPIDAMLHVEFCPPIKQHSVDNCTNSATNRISHGRRTCLRGSDRDLAAAIVYPFSAKLGPYALQTAPIRTLEGRRSYRLTAAPLFTAGMTSAKDCRTTMHCQRLEYILVLYVRPDKTLEFRGSICEPGQVALDILIHTSSGESSYRLAERRT